MKLITWNVQWCRGIDAKVDPARIVRTARDIADFDVLCLQEVAVNFPGLPGSDGADQVAELLRSQPGFSALRGCYRRRRRQRRPQPVRQSGFIALARAPGISASVAVAGGPHGEEHAAHRGRSDSAGRVGTRAHHHDPS
jgi:endonuclease/exonuclease/phosphatase family metal-dependent hydrolase